MLEDILEKFKIVNSVGEEIGKIKEVYLNLDNWDVKYFKISPGMLKGSFLLNIKEIHLIDTENLRMVVNDEYTKGEIPDKPTRDMYPYDELIKRNVVDSDGEKVGKIYSLEIPYEKLKSLKVWKLLIKTGVKDRRLRIAPTEVGEVMDEINLRKTIDFYQDRQDEN
jgi:sporulation protein YlmC with PRC-barrel domain